ncbi:unnamed protein product [Leuciscus chuanchicus]
MALHSCTIDKEINGRRNSEQTDLPWPRDWRMSIQTQTDPKKQVAWWHIPAAMPQGLLTEMTNTGGEFWSSAADLEPKLNQRPGRLDLAETAARCLPFTHTHTVCSDPPVHCVNVDIVSYQ